MNQRIWIDPRLAQVQAAGVCAYLQQRGWTLQPYPGPELLVFGGPVDDDGEAIIQVIPSDESMLDFPMRIEELIGSLSVLEGRPATEILADLLHGGSSPPRVPMPHNGAVAPVTPAPAAD